VPWQIVVTLKDGRQISGQIESGSPREIQIRVDNHAQAIAVDQIQSIQFDPPATAAPAPVGAQTVTLPVGTEIAVRTIERIDSKKADLYKEYAVSLDDPVVVNGVTVIPVSSKAVLRVSDLQQRKLKHSSLSLTLIAVTVSEQRVSVETGSLDSQSGSKVKRTLAGAGIGGGAGAAIGSAAGPVGAAIGAGAGAATGMIVGAATGRGVEIAPETRFTYKLTQPLVINYQVAVAKVMPTQIQPPVQTPAPVQISIGQSIAEVTAALGQPSKIAEVGAGKIYFFKDMKVTFTDGKVSDVHLTDEKPAPPSSGGSVPRAQAGGLVEPEREAANDR
jgi:hypothetical protein